MSPSLNWCSPGSRHKQWGPGDQMMPKDFVDIKMGTMTWISDLVLFQGKAKALGLGKK